MQIKQQAELIRLEKEQVSLQKQILAKLPGLHYKTEVAEIDTNGVTSVSHAIEPQGMSSKMATSMGATKSYAIQKEMAKDTQEISGSFAKGAEAEQAKLSK